MASTPLRQMQARSDDWARKLKAWERGDVGSDQTGRIAQWRKRATVQVVVPFDDKAVSLEMELQDIAEASEAELSFFIMRSVRECRRQLLH